MFDPCHTLRYMSSMPSICPVAGAALLGPLPPDYDAFPNSATKESRTLAELRLAPGTTNSSNLKP